MSRTSWSKLPGPYGRSLAVPPPASYWLAHQAVAASVAPAERPPFTGPSLLGSPWGLRPCPFSRPLRLSAHWGAAGLGIARRPGGSGFHSLGGRRCLPSAPLLVTGACWAWPLALQVGQRWPPRPTPSWSSDFGALPLPLPPPFIGPRGQPKPFYILFLYLPILLRCLPIALSRSTQPSSCWVA